MLQNDRRPIDRRDVMQDPAADDIDIRVAGKADVHVLVNPGVDGLIGLGHCRGRRRHAVPGMLGCARTRLPEKEG